MRISTFVPLIVSLIAGVVAVWVWIGAIQRAKEGSQPPPAITVMVAKTDIPYGVEIEADMLAGLKFGTFPLEGGFAKSEDLIGRVSATKIVKYAPILGNMLAEKGTLPGVENQIPQGYRAEPVLVASYSVLDLDPGNHVDVLYYANPEGSYQRARTMRRILQNVEVFSVGDRRIGMEADAKSNNATKTPGGRRFRAGSGDKVPVKLIVRNEHVKILREAQMNGIIELSMRPAGDDSILPEEVEIAAAGAVKPSGPRETLQKAPPPKLEPIIHTMKIFNGSEEKTEQFQMGMRLVRSGEDAESGSGENGKSQTAQPAEKESEPD